MLEKYTIFDNFDKLDLNPVASLINPDKARTDRPVSFDLVSNATANGTIIYNKFNETNHADLNGKMRPIAYFSDLKSIVPDFYNYISNNKFFIDILGEIQHSSKIFDQYSGENLLALRTLFYNNVLYDGFFFDIFLKNYEPAFSDAVMLYENPFYSLEDPEGQTIAAYNNSIDNYFIPDSDNFSNLKAFNPDDISVNNNKAAFYRSGLTGDTFNFGNDLFYHDILQYNQPPYSEILGYLLTEQPEVFAQMVLLIQRLIYPYNTPNNEVPKHNYFVTDLKKSNDNLPIIVSSAYNYYLDKAEKPPENVQLEWQLPSINAYSSHFFSLPFNKPYYDDIIKLDSTDNLVTSGLTTEKYYNISNNSNSYINFANSNNDEEYSKFYKLLRHQTNVFGEKVDEITEAIQSIKHIFPYYHEIIVPPAPSPVMSQINKIDGMLDMFMSFVSNYFSSLENSQVHTFALHNKELINTQISMSDIQILDIEESTPALNYFTPAAFGAVLGLPNNKFAFNNDSPLTAEQQYGNGIAYENSIKFIKNTLINDCEFNKLSIKEILSGEKCKSEILAFEIVKYSLSEGGVKTKLQSFFVPCLTDKSKTLLDTQIFSEKEYIYEVFSISLVAGVQYESLLNTPNDGGKFAQKEVPLINFSIDAAGDELKFKKLSLLNSKSYGVDSTPNKPPIITKPLLIRAPFYNNSSILNEKEQETITTVNMPPLPPEISFYPYKDVDDKILITLNIIYGERRLNPIRVFPEDSEKISSYFKSQKNVKGYKPGQLIYKTDDFLGTHKVYRTTIKPTNWTAFYDSTPVEINNEQSAGFQDNINANVDYYYFARFEDIKGNISNPTNIFYLRLVKEGGFPPYLIIKTYDFSEGRNTFIYEKSFKKYLKIRLADGTRKYFNTDKLNEMDFSYSKSNSSRSLKKYKVRITSKSTGKKIDINIGFNKKISSQYLNKTINTEKTTTGKKAPVYEQAPLPMDIEKIQHGIEKDIANQLLPPQESIIFEEQQQSIIEEETGGD